ncbi:outer membrane beta-barrel protein [bacterium]|nr:outer membrane beta-barrel protein [bacterium]
MKKTLVVVMIMLLAVGGSAFAQMSGYGAKVGLGYNMAGGEDSDGIDPGIGFAVGGFVDYGFSEMIGLTGGLQYLSRSYSSENPVGDDITTTYSYISIPIDLTYKIEMEGDMMPWAFIGPEFGFLMGADSDGTDVSDFTSGMDMGLNIGAGMAFTPQWAVDLRYYYGLTSIDDSGADLDIKHGGIMFGVRYNFMK